MAALGARRIHLAPNGRGLTVCGLVAARVAWRPRWTAVPPTPRAWRCGRCRRVLRLRRPQLPRA